MREAGKLLESGRLAIVPGVGLSQPEPLAFPQHGDLAVGPAGRARTTPGWAGSAAASTRARRPATAPGRVPDRARRPAAGHARPAGRQRRAGRLDDYALSDKEAGARAGRLLHRRGRPGAVPAPQPAGRLHHGGPPGGRRRGPRRPGVLSRVRAGPAARPDGAADQGRPGHARLLSRAGGL